MSVVVIGAGQAGLAVSRGLSLRGVGHVVLERAHVAQAWRDRWDSFTLVTPNWTLGLPGSPYQGDEPEGHVARDEIIAYFDRYAKEWAVPVREGVEVTRLAQGTSRRFALFTSDGEIETDDIVVCTGAFQRPHRLDGWQFPAEVPVIDALGYRSPDAIDQGPVLVIGCGETGCQIAEELHLAGHEVYLSCGRAPWFPRRLDGVDTVTWLYRAGFFEQRLADITDGVRLLANPQYTGADGGRDLHYRTLQDLGVTLLGRCESVHGGVARFADDLAGSVAFGDARWADVRTFLADKLPASGYAVPDMDEPPTFTTGEAITSLDLTDFAAVILATGFRPDYGWIDFPIFDEIGYPITTDGAISDPRGLYFCGVHFMRIRRSGFVYGVGDDAELVAEAIASDR